MLRPVIMIGCGGAGLKTVRMVREGVQRRLDRAGWDGPFPNSWQFIGIDGPDFQEDSTISPLPTNDYINLCPRGVTYENLESAVDARFPQGLAGSKEMMGWRPHLNDLVVPLHAALPSSRAIGRVIFIASQNIVRQRVKRAFVECNGDGPILSEVSQRLGVIIPDGTPVPAPITIVVGSMAGGTGAGFMLDVVDLLRQTHVDGAFPTMIAYTEDIFGFGLSLSNQLIANQTAFVSEFLSAYWNDEATDSALIPPVIRTDSRGPHSTFMIGRKTMDGLDLGNSQNVFRSVGETLASVMTSARMQEQFTYLGTTFPLSGVNNRGAYGWHETLTKGAISSFGCATLSIGRDRFREYLLRLLQRSIMDHLTNGFNRAAVSYLGAEAAKELPQRKKIIELSRLHRDEFMFACELLEDNTHRQISDRFVSDIHLREECQIVVEAVGSPFLNGGQQNGKVWAFQINSQAQMIKEAWQVRAEEQMSSSQMQWGLDLLQKVLKTCTEFSARLSLPVVMELIELVRADLLELATLMKDSANTDRKNADLWFGEAQSYFENGTRGYFDLSSDLVQKTIRDNARAITLAWSAKVRDQLTVMLESVSYGMLKTIRTELQQSLDRLSILTTSHDGKGSFYWPEYIGVIPDSFMPSTVEFCLEDHTDWPETARAILEASLGEDRHLLPVDPIEATRTRLIQGSFVGSRGEMVPPLVWVETHEEGTPSWSIEQPVEVRVFDGLIDLEKRIDSWLMRSSTATEECLNEGLSSYLSKVNPRTGVPVPNHTSRLAIYQKKLEEALNQSRPLIEIDQKMYATVHSQDIKTSLNVQGFPFGEGHPARLMTQEVVRGFLRTHGDVEWIFSADEAESVLISSFLDNPVSPSVVSSFTQTLGQSVSKFVHGGLLNSSFWLWPRTRLLKDFIPLPDELRLSAIRGFAIARSLGYCTATIDEVNCIINHNGVHEFPRYLLTATNRNNVLPALLESMVLTFADVPTKGKAAFNAYGALINYGMGGGSVNQFELPNEMVSFLNDNEFVYDVVDDIRRERIMTDDFLQRKGNVLRDLDGYLSNLQRLNDQPPSKTYWRNRSGAVHPTDTLLLELMSDLQRGFTDVRIAVQNHNL